MEWHQIDLKDIGCFKSRSIDFSQLSVIYGENRTGKSTLVYALFFALFGKHLNPHLKMKDLCRKGARHGTAALQFSRNGEGFEIHQKTDGMPRLLDASGVPVNLNDPKAIDAYIPIAPEIASLSSFFRENEILFFLQDAPKYNQTLLQYLIGFDAALILKSRFKKALARAREIRRSLRNASPRRPADPLNIAMLSRQLSEAEKEFEQVDHECRSASGRTTQDPTVYQLLHKQFEEKKANLQRLTAMQKERPPSEKLAAEKKQLEEQASAFLDSPDSTGSLEQKMGALSQEKNHIRRRLKQIQALEKTHQCLLCEQEISKEHIKQLKINLAEDAKRIKTREAAVETQLEALKKQKTEHAIIKKQLETLSVQLQENQALENQINTIREQQGRIADDLKAFETARGNLEKAEADFCRQENLDSRRTRLQEKIVTYKVQLGHQKDHLRRSEDHQKHMDAAERNVLICRCAFQAMDNAIQSLGNQLTHRIRESLKNWRRHFSFLQHFDINLDEGELLPMIQARGYQYKLNQMSKSERIFLYLLLKLAIGDALGHLGVFVLDDPADGLDMKRKETLAYLLTEISRKRQVVVTTNDPVFADMFHQSHRVNL